MTQTALAKKSDADIVEQVLVTGNLGSLSAEQRVFYYNKLCKSLGLNPLTKPFEYIILNGKLTLYALRTATDQLRSRRGVSVQIMARELVEDTYVVTARAKLPDGREDESVGAVPLGGLKGEARANALMKAETKAKRRVTLSICGLGMLDESEVGTIPGAVAPPATPAPVARMPAAPREQKPREEPQTVVDEATGEERPVPAPGFHYIANYRRRGDWHEFDLLNAAADGSALHVSTKKKLGFRVADAARGGLPIRVTTSPKPSGGPGEVYLESVELGKLPASLEPFAGDPPAPDPDTCPTCGLSTQDCPGHDPDDGELVF